MAELIMDFLEVCGARIIDFCAALVPDKLPQKKKKTLRVVFAIIAAVMLAVFVVGIVLLIHSEQTIIAGIVLVAVSASFFVACLVKDVTNTVRK